MSSTLAGNLTMLGSVANLIVVQKARHEVQISFWDYFKVGAPLTVLTIAAESFCWGDHAANLRPTLSQTTCMRLIWASPSAQLRTYALRHLYTDVA